MTRFLLDTGVASDYLNMRNEVYPRVRSEQARGNPVGISMLVLAELVFGIEKSESREENMRLLELVLPSLKIWPFSEDAAYEFGRLRAQHLRTGRAMQIIDIMIAATALTLPHCVVVSTDSDLFAVPGLRVENWAA